LKQGIQMLNEKQILTLVSNVLQKNNIASFTSGCLFIKCDENEARKVFHTLSKEFGLGTVEISGPIQGEYAFDI
jgi:phosphosulfolactate synthase (CoM biosynthesis protein A)